MLVGYASYYGTLSNMVAESRALLDGLHLAQKLGIKNVMIESDSQVLVNWLRSGVCTLWFMWDFWEKIKELYCLLECSVSHIFREANMVANYIAKEGVNGICRTVTGHNIGTGTLRGLLWTNALEIPYIRMK